MPICIDFVHLLCVYWMIQEKRGKEILIRWVGSHAATDMMIRWVRSHAATGTWSMCGPHGSWSVRQRVCITRIDMHHYYLILHSIICISRHSFHPIMLWLVMIIWSAIEIGYSLYYLTCLCRYMISFDTDLMTLDESART